MGDCDTVRHREKLGAQQEGVEWRSLRNQKGILAWRGDKRRLDNGSLVRKEGTIRPNRNAKRESKTWSGHSYRGTGGRKKHVN